MEKILNNKDILKTVYAKNLEKAHNLYTSEYTWEAKLLPSVLERMYIAIDKMSFNKDSKAWQMTCKELKIKHTYKQIQEFINS